MKTKKKRVSSTVFIAAVLTMLAMCSHQLSAQTAAGHQSKSSSAALWSVQVDKVDPGDVNLEPAFRITIYENLLQELRKTKQFKQVLRSGERDASGVPDLLILKTAVQKYSPGSETRRAVTTVSGATKLNVRSQLCKPDGTVVVDLVVDGNVRFLGGNLRATHNLARNVADKLKDSKLPDAAEVGKS
jgi:hypothetical protein